MDLRDLTALVLSSSLPIEAFGSSTKNVVAPVSLVSAPAAVCICVGGWTVDGRGSFEGVPG